jgi:hypothetical protein
MQYLRPPRCTFKYTEEASKPAKRISSKRKQDISSHFSVLCHFCFPGSGTNQDQDRNSTKNPPKNMQQNSFLTIFPDPVISSKPTKTVIRYGSNADLSDPYRMCLGLLDPDLDPEVRGPDPDPAIIKQRYSKKNLDSYCYVTSF